MLLPQVWLRKLWLQRALRDYPLYDPPHKVEERLLAREQALENFDYFMHVRHQRVAYFRDWLRSYFGVTITPDAKGIKALNRWGNKYAGLLLYERKPSEPTHSYFTYDPPWTGKNAGCNALFDMGVTMGEFIIANCPKLYWAVDPTQELLPRTTRKLKREPGSSFQKPKLAGSDNPTWTAVPLHDAEMFAWQMQRNMTTFEGMQRFCRRHKADRALVRESFLSKFESTLKYYPAFDPNMLRNEMSSGEYLQIIDSQDEENGNE
jgi:hypothetical protein